MRGATREAVQFPLVGPMAEEVAICFAPRPARLAPGRMRWDEYPRIGLAAYAPPSGEAVSVDLDEWQSGRIDFDRIDARADALAAQGLIPVSAVGHPEARLQLLTRCQRWLDRRNLSSRQLWFDELLRRHADLYDRNCPLVRADHNHALDTWQWVLRLDAGASSAVQVAALYHGIERIVDADRSEPRAGDSGVFAEGRAARSAERLRDFAAGVVAEPIARRAAELVAAVGPQEGPTISDRRELDLLEDADALSFFSLESSGFLDYRGERQTAREIERTLCRLTVRALSFLCRVRLRGDVADLVEDTFLRRL
jgi:hypothetical protein